MFGLISSFKTIEALDDWQKLNAKSLSEQERRARFKIAVIDDEAFAAGRNLRNAGYQITEVGDIKSVNELDDYQIVLCDLQGVGMHFNSKFQGGFLIDEIKKRYPEKIVIAYTGGALDQGVLRYAQMAADDFVKKDVDINEWRNTLDEVIDALSDPVVVWKRQRDALVDADISTKSILKLEDAYVKSVLKGDPSTYVYYVNNPTLQSDIRAIGQSLIASGIFKLFFE